MQLTTADLRASLAERLPINFALLIVVDASRCPCMKTSTRAPGALLSPPSSGPLQTRPKWRIVLAGQRRHGRAGTRPAPPRRRFQEDTRCLSAPKRLLAR
ncbi:hypothetical protein LMG29660_00177 [Burkholderia puraquae]|uniref:Uncharacterized protein n=1 Tax=Burkholderia puraquae TaxID=1904757 RepID=A0A6J5CZZ8_9BURK|nr:hypothetical protein LMG29660_00177 [Burkholderia puraquae]